MTLTQRITLTIIVAVLVFGIIPYSYSIGAGRGYTRGFSDGQDTASVYTEHLQEMVFDLCERYVPDEDIPIFKNLDDMLDAQRELLDAQREIGGSDADSTS